MGTRARNQLLKLIAIGAIATIFGCGGGGGVSSTTWQFTAGPGIYKANNGFLKVELPSGAVAGSTTVVASPEHGAVVPPVGFTYVTGSAWSFTHVDFAKAGLITIYMSNLPISPSQMAKAQFFRMDPGSLAWVPVTTAADSGVQRASASINGLSTYALFLPLTP